MTAENINKQSWYLFDLDGKILGRACSQIAIYLMGKHLPSFSSSDPSGGYVVVLNASKIKITGNKLDQKYYYKHSGYIGNLKKESLRSKMESSPTDVIKRAVSGMLPKNKLKDKMLSRLKIYPLDQHPHQNIKFTEEFK